MIKTPTNVLIVGGGLSGLTLAYLLSKKNINTIVLESSSRLGGRIQTLKGIRETPLELGATWFSEMHPNLVHLIKELGLKKYQQFAKGISLYQTKSFEPPQEFFVSKSESPSYRIAGGTEMLISKLHEKIIPKNIHLNTKIISITEHENEIIAETANGQKLHANKVIISIPPQLVASQIHFYPELPKAFSDILPTVQTWMSGTIKFVLEYKESFWRNNGYSGMLYSHSGIVKEMYDHTNFEENKFGFTGFLDSSSASYSQTERKEFVLQQLTELLGKDAANPILYFDKIWNDEYVVIGNPLIQKPHQNNGHAILQKAYMNGKLLFSGTETATEFGGYMEGAVISALKIVNDF